VILTATPSGGSTFGGWSGACSGTAACTLTVNASTTATATFTLSAQSSPVPVATSLSPATAQAGTAGLTITVNGSGFVASSVATWGGSPRATTVISANQLRFDVTASDLTTASSVPVTVVTPAPGGGTSAALTFTISAPPPAAGEIIIDNAAAGVQDSAGGRTFTGRWCGSNANGHFGPDSLVSCGFRRDTYRWTPNIQLAGDYDVYVWWAAARNRSTSAPFTVVSASGTTTLTFNERTGGGQWVLHGRYTFNAGTSGYIETSDANGSAGADAVRLVPATAQSSSAPRPSGSPAADFTTTGLVAGQVVTTPIRVQNFPAVGTGPVFNNFAYAILSRAGATVFTNQEFSQPYCLAGDDGTACFFWDPASIGVGAYTVRITMTYVEGGANKAVVKTIPFSVAR
jgi:hypothetical protein